MSATNDRRVRIGGASGFWGDSDIATPQLLAEGTIRIGCVDVQTFRPRRIPAGILERLGG